jgi:hypothetical protein
MNLEGNNIHSDFLHTVNEELKQNKSISEIIIPTIKTRERDKRKKKEKKEKRQSKSLKAARRKSRADDFLGGSSQLEGERDRKDAKLQELDIEKLTASARIVKDGEVDLDPIVGRRATEQRAVSSSSASSTEDGKSARRSSALSRISEGDENDSDGVK